MDLIDVNLIVISLLIINLLVTKKYIISIWLQNSERFSGL